MVLLVTLNAASGWYVLVTMHRNSSDAAALAEVFAADSQRLSSVKVRSWTRF